MFKKKKGPRALDSHGNIISGVSVKCQLKVLCQRHGNILRDNLSFSLQLVSFLCDHCFHGLLSNYREFVGKVKLVFFFKFIRRGSLVPAHLIKI